MAAQQGRTISQLHNGLKLDGKLNASGTTDFILDKDDNVVVGLDANGNWTGKAFAPRTQSRTATADGLTTGIIADNVDFVIATSAGATNALTLPAASAATIGRHIDIHVAANGYELLTPATGNNTINTVDSDGTNQLDVAANTLLRLVQVTATGWVAYQVAATTITVVAPDND